MRPRAYLSVWAAAILLAAAGVSLPVLHSVATPSRILGSDLGDAQIVIIGSSLTYQAFPYGEVDGGVLADGRAHRIRAKPWLSEPETVALLNEAVGQPVETIILEANDFAIDQSVSHGELGFVGAIDRATYWLLSHAKRGILLAMSRGYMDLYDGDLRTWEYYETPAREVGEIGGVTIDVTLKSPSQPDRIAGLADTARRRGIGLVLIRPPVPRVYYRLIEPVDEAALADHVASVAARLGLPLWQPDGPWPNDQFADRNHLNRRGHERFLREFRAWYEARR